MTLSQEQIARAPQRAESQDLADRALFTLTDYRAVDGRFDRIVSVGMSRRLALR